MAEAVRVNVKITDEELKGRYCNMMRVTHDYGEFTLDFINRVQDQGIVTARVITSPGHVKMLIQALSANLETYEKRFGPIQGPPAGGDPVN